jgi:hypothetical protein
MATMAVLHPGCRDAWAASFDAGRNRPLGFMRSSTANSALTDTAAAIENSGGGVVTYRKPLC